MSSALIQASQSGDLTAVRQVLDGEPGVLDATGTYRVPRHTPADHADSTGTTALTHAAQAGHTEVVRELLTRGADPRRVRAVAAQSEGDSEAFALVRDAALRADTRAANAVASPVPGAQGAEATGEAPASHLPPPEVAKQIPCKYFPNCRYGDRCVFRHPTGAAAAAAMAGGDAQVPPMFVPGMPFPYGVPPPPLMEMNGGMYPMPMDPNQAPMFPMPPNAGAPNGAPNGEEGAEAQQAGNAGNTDRDGSAQPSRAPRSARSGGKGRAQDERAPRGEGSSRRTGGTRPSCAFFARSACRYANECRFPHVLPDGTQVPTKYNPEEDAARSAQRSAARRAASSQSGSATPQDGNASGSETPNTPGSDGSSPRTSGAKKSFRNGRAPNAGSNRGKNARRTQSAGPGRKVVQQRVPNSDEFPALSASSGASPRTADGNAEAPKANFSAILSAPAPSKPARTEEEQEPNGKQPTAEQPQAPQEASKPAPTEAPSQPPAERSNDESAQESNAGSMDFAAAVSAQSNAITA